MKTFLENEAENDELDHIDIIKPKYGSYKVVPIYGSSLVTKLNLFELTGGLLFEQAKYMLNKSYWEELSNDGTLFYYALSQALIRINEGDYDVVNTELTFYAEVDDQDNGYLPFDKRDNHFSFVPADQGWDSLVDVLHSKGIANANCSMDNLRSGQLNYRIRTWGADAEQDYSHMLFWVIMGWRGSIVQGQPVTEYPDSLEYLWRAEVNSMSGSASAGLDTDDRADRTVVQDDFVIVPGPSFPEDVFGAGLYDVYIDADKVGSGEPVVWAESSYDEDELLTDLRLHFSDVSGKNEETRFSLWYEKKGSLITAFEIDAANLTPLFPYLIDHQIEMLGSKNDAAKWSDILQDRMPMRIEFVEPIEIGASATGTCVDLLREKIYKDLEENSESEIVANALSNFAYVNWYVPSLASAVSWWQSTVNKPKGIFNVESYDIKIENRLTEYYGMSVSPEELNNIIMETEQDSRGNITLVRRYNDYAVYDDVFSYDSANRMIRQDHYEYSRAVNREAAGTQWHCEYSYDSEGRLLSYRYIYDQGSGRNYTYSYTYDNNGRLIQAATDLSWFVWADKMYNIVVMNYEYNDEGKVGCVILNASDRWNVDEPISIRYVPVK